MGQLQSAPALPEPAAPPTTPSLINLKENDRALPELPDDVWDLILQFKEKGEKEDAAKQHAFERDLMNLRRRAVSLQELCNMFNQHQEALKSLTDESAERLTKRLDYMLTKMQKSYGLKSEDLTLSYESMRDYVYKKKKKTLNVMDVVRVIQDIYCKAPDDVIDKTRQFASPEARKRLIEQRRRKERVFR